MRDPPGRRGDLHGSDAASVSGHFFETFMQVLRLTDQQFESIAQIAYELWGLQLTEKKRELVTARLAKMIRRGVYESFEDVIRRVLPDDHLAERLALFDILSTNHTSFYREKEHFACLVDECNRIRERSAEPHRLRVWSAGCSNGCEPYTMSMVLHDNVRDLSEWDVRILATDLASTELVKARNAVYPFKAVEKLAPGQLERHFDLIKNAGGDDTYSVKAHLRLPISFSRLNLMDPWKMKGPFDAIFCRNVMIYFDDRTKLRLVNRFSQLLRPGGILFVGSAESMVGHMNGMQTVQPSAYRKVA